jgi:hypothetical protein
MNANSDCLISLAAFSRFILFHHRSLFNELVYCLLHCFDEVSEWKKHSARKSAKHTPEDLSQHPVGRIGTPADIAAMVFYLVSPAAGFITGSNFIVDGGMTKKMIYV